MTLDHYSESTAYSAVLEGRKIVRVSVENTGTNGPGNYSPGQGFLELDDGTILEVYPNYGGCCGAGDYELTHLATVDNIITRAEFIAENMDDYHEEHTYRLFVFTENGLIKQAMTIHGDDGNGYYGSGFEIVVKEKASDE
jgi:hypothetical protein